MIINYKGKEKRITDKTLIYIYNKAKELNSDMLMNDVEAVLYDHNAFNFERTMKRLESAFRNAVYAGIYEAFEFEMYCKYGWEELVEGGKTYLEVVDKVEN